jgi:hypothetical protein
LRSPILRNTSAGLQVSTSAVADLRRVTSGWGDAPSTLSFRSPGR